MRRPCFHRWIRRRVLELAQMRMFNLRMFAARAQQDPGGELAAALLLYAHENDCLERLMAYVYDPDLRREYEAVERHLGQRSIERLALRGTPLQSLPERYRAFLEEFERAYHRPEHIAAEKRVLLDQTRAAVLRSGASPTELARQLNLDRANVSAYLAHGEIGRLTLEDAKRLLRT